MTKHSYSLAGNSIETPLINAAGSINGTSEELILREVETLAATAIGAITVGSFTVPPQVGNEAKYGGPVYYHDKRAGATYNSMGLPNIGLDAAKRLIPAILSRAKDEGKPMIASVSPAQSSYENGGSTFEQVDRLVEGLLEAEADLIEVNTSCPNVVIESGGRKPILGYDPEAMEELLDTVSTTAGSESLKIGLKLPPYNSDEEKLVVPRLANLFRHYRTAFNFLVTPNTIPNQIARNAAGKPILNVPGGAGGMSGPATKQIGREQLQMWHGLVGDEFEVISTLGVDNGKELAIRRQLGAVAAGGVTFLWESDNWGMAVTDMIGAWVEAEEL